MSSKKNRARPVPAPIASTLPPLPSEELGEAIDSGGDPDEVAEDLGHIAGVSRSEDWSYSPEENEAMSQEPDELAEIERGAEEVLERHAPLPEPVLAPATVVEPAPASIAPALPRGAQYTADQFVLPWSPKVPRGTSPKRPGTKAAEAWAIYEGGRRIGDYLADRRADKRKLREALAWDIERGLVTIASSLEG